MSPNEQCSRIADQVVPEYRGGARSYSCTGTIAKRWNAAYEAAKIAEVRQLPIEDVIEAMTNVWPEGGRSPDYSEVCNAIRDLESKS